MVDELLKQSETLLGFSTIHIGVVLNPIPKPSSPLPWWAMSDPGKCGEIGPSFLPLLFLNDRRQNATEQASDNATNTCCSSIFGTSRHGGPNGNVEHSAGTPFELEVLHRGHLAANAPR
jgi:hypothetical protein